ncbi:MAG TPA: 1-acyl-sn-glycerol-3-phosphate acyltransferase [Epulopiscium sp.]|nr:1-acyl-sn-glycerol-3-phosphate acyltransferase [Candidatus Epulonipiscium sp.]
MRSLICVLYIIFYTWITAPARYKNHKVTDDEEAIKRARVNNYRLTQGLCRGIIRIAGIKLEVQGQENLLNRGTSVYMGTHKSYLDVVIMIALIDEPLTFIGKAEVDKLPFIRTWFHAIGGLSLEREDIRQSFKVIIEAIEELKEGHSVAIFPEGTRAKGREMGAFKAGSFKLATKANVPIIPIVMQDTFKLLEEKKRLRPATIHVKIGDAIDVPFLSKEKKQTIAKDTENHMKRLLENVTI